MGKPFFILPDGSAVDYVTVADSKHRYPMLSAEQAEALIDLLGVVHAFLSAAEARPQEINGLTLEFAGKLRDALPFAIFKKEESR